MASNSDIQLIISAKDNAKPVLDRLMKTLPGIGQEAKRAGENIGRGFNVEHLKQMERGFQSLSFHVRDVVRQTSALVPEMAALGSAASIAGIAALARAYGDLGTKLQYTGARAGVPIQRLQQLQDAVQLGGGDPTAVAGALATLHDHATGALNGTDANARRLFNTLGLSEADMKAPTAELFEKVRGKIATLWGKNPTYADQVGSGLLGNFEALAPAITRPDFQTKLEKDATGLHPGLDPDAAAAADKLREQLADISIQAKTVGEQIMVELAGPLTTVAKSFSDILKDSQGDIGQGAREFGEWLKGVHWSEIAGDVHQVASEVNAVVQALGGWKNVTEDIIALYAGTKFLGLIKTLRSLGGAFAPGAGGAGGGAPGGGPGGGGVLGWLGAMSMWKVAFDAVSGNAPVPDEDTFKRNNLGHGFLQDFIDAHFGSGGYPTQARPVPLTDSARKANALSMSSVFAQHGYTQEGIAALIGSGIQESGLNPQSGAGSAHQAIFQWDANRQRQIEAHFRKRLLDMSPAENAEAAAWEIDNKPEFAALKKQLRYSHDLALQNAGVTGTFEAPANPGTPELAMEQKKRLGLSQGALALLQQQPAAPVNMAPQPASTGNGGGPQGNGQVTIRLNQDGRVKGMDVDQHGDNFQLKPLPTGMPMLTEQGG